MSLKYFSPKYVGKNLWINEQTGIFSVFATQKFLNFFLKIDIQSQISIAKKARERYYFGIFDLIIVIQQAVRIMPRELLHLLDFFVCSLYYESRYNGVSLYWAFVVHLLWSYSFSGELWIHPRIFQNFNVTHPF